MAVPTATFAGNATGSESRRSSRASEIWKLTGGSGGSADGDAVAITTRHMKRPALVVGAVSVTSIAAQVVTVALITALAEGEIIYVEIMGLP